MCLMAMFLHCRYIFLMFSYYVFVYYVAYIVIVLSVLPLLSQIHNKQFLSRYLGSTEMIYFIKKYIFITKIQMISG